LKDLYLPGIGRIIQQAAREIRFRRGLKHSQMPGTGLKIFQNVNKHLKPGVVPMLELG
jgi:hypothetical protein